MQPSAAVQYSVLKGPSGPGQCPSDWLMGAPGRGSGPWIYPKPLYPSPARRALVLLPRPRGAPCPNFADFFNCNTLFLYITPFIFPDFKEFGFSACDSLISSPFACACRSLSFSQVPRLAAAISVPLSERVDASATAMHHHLAFPVKYGSEPTARAGRG